MEGELNLFCKSIKSMINEKQYDEAEGKIVKMLAKYPHSPVPHNLLGLLLEKESNHILAMKHFRAGYALDPTYLPCRYNMNQYGSMYPTGKFAYCEEDCYTKKEHAKEINIIK